MKDSPCYSSNTHNECFCASEPLKRRTAQACVQHSLSHTALQAFNISADEGLYWNLFQVDGERSVDHMEFLLLASCEHMTTLLLNSLLVSPNVTRARGVWPPVAKSTESLLKGTRWAMSHSEVSTHLGQSHGQSSAPFCRLSFGIFLALPSVLARVVLDTVARFSTNRYTANL